MLWIPLRNISSTCLIKYPWHTQKIIARERNLSHEGQMILIRSHSKSSSAHMAQLSTKHLVTLRCHAVLPSFPFHTGCCSCVPVSPCCLRICWPPALRALVLSAPGTWGWGHLLISHFPYPGEGSAHMVWFCVEAEHMHRGSTPDLWRSRNSIYFFISEESYSPFILLQPAAALLLAQQVECELSSLCLPCRARGAKSWWQLSRAWRAFPEGSWVPPPAAEILTNTRCCFHKPPSSSLLCPGRDLLPWCSVTVPRQETGISQCLSYRSDV